MKINPASLTDLSRALARASASGERVERVELTALNRVLEHTPEDMTVTVEAGIVFSSFQTQLAKRRQWIPLDPPRADTLTIGDLLSADASGPRRFGYGKVRDYVIGLKVVLADGRVIKSGGKVVKNVAGYDLQKLFIGGGGTLAVPVEVTFKLRPLPERESFVQQRFDTLDAAGVAIEAVIESELAPVVFDLHRAAGEDFALVLGFDGMKEDVEWQLDLAIKRGFVESGNLDYDQSFHAGAKPFRELSVLPSKLVETLRTLGNEPFVARAGNGIVYHRADVATPQPNLPATLLRRVKDTFDPKHLLPELPR